MDQLDELASEVTQPEIDLADDDDDVTVAEDLNLGKDVDLAEDLNLAEDVDLVDDDDVASYSEAVDDEVLVQTPDDDEIVLD